MRAAIALIITAGIAVTAGMLGFQAGVASNVGAAGGTIVVGGGLGLVGLFLFLGFLFFSFLGLAAVIGGRRRHHGPWAMRGVTGPGGFGPGGGEHAASRRAWLAEMHRSLHEEEAATGRTGAAGGSTGAAGA